MSLITILITTLITSCLKALRTILSNPFIIIRKCLIPFNVACTHPAQCSFIDKTVGESMPSESSTDDTSLNNEFLVIPFSKSQTTVSNYVFNLSQLLFYSIWILWLVINPWNSSLIQHCVLYIVYMTLQLFFSLMSSADALSFAFHFWMIMTASVNIFFAHRDSKNLLPMGVVHLTNHLLIVISMFVQ